MRKIFLILIFTAIALVLFQGNLFAFDILKNIRTLSEENQIKKLIFIVEDNRFQKLSLSEKRSIICSDYFKFKNKSLDHKDCIFELVIADLQSTQVQNNSTIKELKNEITSLRDNLQNQKNSAQVNEKLDFLLKEHEKSIKVQKEILETVEGQDARERHWNQIRIANNLINGRPMGSGR
jgi:hypothetical protein